MKLSQIVKNQRQKLSLTLDQLSNRTRLTKGFLSRLEKGDFDLKNISLGTIIKLANGFKIRVKEILDNLNLIEQEDPPPLNIYLRKKYNIEEDSDVQVIDDIINRLKKKV